MLDRLYWLELNSTSVTSDGLREISKHKKLESLYLNRNPHLDDRVVDHFTGLEFLNKVELTETQVSVEGFERLRQQFPHTEFHASNELHK